MEEGSSCPGGEAPTLREGAPSTQGRQLLLNLVLGSAMLMLHPKDLVLLRTLVLMD